MLIDRAQVVFYSVQVDVSDLRENFAGHDDKIKHIAEDAFGLSEVYRCVVRYSIGFRIYKKCIFGCVIGDPKNADLI